MFIVCGYKRGNELNEFAVFCKKNEVSRSLDCSRRESRITTLLSEVIGILSFYLAMEQNFGFLSISSNFKELKHFPGSSFFAQSIVKEQKIAADLVGLG